MLLSKSKKIAPENSADDVFYICTALGKDEPQGKYIFGEGDKDSKNPTEDDKKPSDEKLNDKTSKPDTTAKPQEKTDKPQEPKEDSSSVQKPSETVTDYSQKKPEYSKEDIQKLLDKIAALEDDGENVDRAEIERLNKQLDEILKSYRK